jgi:hypothetical protein
MSGYWIKIALKAFAIFAIGMIIITGFRSAKGKVQHALESNDPIPIPVIGLVPFKIDNSKMGSVSRVEFLRSDPEHISGVRVLVKLADSISPDRLRSCQIALDDVERINDQTTFRCAESGDATAGLAPFGVVTLKNSSDSFPLLLPAHAIDRLRETSFSVRNGKVKIESPPTSREMMVSRVDSMHSEIESLIDAQSDSIDNLKDLSSDLEDSAAEAPRDKRRAIQKSADSVRAVMRNLVDRMKANEGRMHALEKITQMQEMQRDWKPVDGVTIADSVQQFVNAELAKVQQELARQGVTGVNVQVHLDSASAAAMREGMARSQGQGRAATGRGAPARDRGGVAVEAPTPPAAPPAAAATPKPAATPKVEATPKP